MPEAQARIVAEIERLRELHAEERVAIVGHGDVIKAAVAHYLGVHLDLFQRIEIGPASISTIQLSAWGPRILSVNATQHLSAGTRTRVTRIDRMDAD